MARFSLYCITLFLSPDHLQEAVASLEACGIQSKKCSVADQTGEACAAFHAKAGGVPLMLAPCNDFHYDGDYEIGLTVQNRADWDSLLAEAKARGLALETGTDADGSRYAIPQGVHGPFFMLDDVPLASTAGMHNTPADSESPTTSADHTAPALISLTATLTASEAALYETSIHPLLEPALSDALHITTGGRFALQKLQAGTWRYTSS